jgi:hypothetical protein
VRGEKQLLALKVLFTEEQVSLFKNNCEWTISVERLTSIWIVQLIHEDKAHFIRHNFADHYVAECFVDCLTEGIKTSHQVQDFTLKVTLLEDDCRVFRFFVCGLLPSSILSDDALKQYGNVTTDIEIFVIPTL